MHIRYHYWIIAMLFITSALTGACAGKIDPLAGLDTDAALYQSARSFIEKGRFGIAIPRLEAIETQFPFGPYSEQAQIELLYALHRLGRHPEVIARAEKFLSLHPNHNQTAYILYIQGQSAYAANFTLLNRVFAVDPSQRDLSRIHEAFNIFNNLLREFPETPYSVDVRLRMTHLRNVLARHELTVANYYLKRKAWLSANRRAQNIITDYPSYPQTNDALAIMVYSYQKMGLDDLANDSLAILRLNYPDYPSLNKRGEFIGVPKLSSRNAFYRYIVRQILPPGWLFDTR